ncbi:hypothetical protein ACTFIR_003979 [Dictyostelium discoideum]
MLVVFQVFLGIRLSIGVVYKVVLQELYLLGIGSPLVSHDVVFQELYLLGIGSPLVGHDVVFQVILGLGHMGRGGWVSVLCGGGGLSRYIINILGSPLVSHDVVFQGMLSMGVVYKVVIQELYLLGIGSPLVGHDVVFQELYLLGIRYRWSIGVVVHNACGLSRY